MTAFLFGVTSPVFTPNRVRKPGLLARAAALAVALLGIGAPGYAGLIITPTFDASITNDVANGATIQASINQAIAVYQQRFTDNITVTITFKEDESIGLGQSSTFFGNVTYANYLTALTTDASTANDATALPFLAGANNPVNGNANINVKTANLRALGFNANPPAGQTDSTISLKTSLMNLSRAGPQDPAKYDLLAVVSHEIDEALGLGSALPGIPNGTIFPQDLFRYSAPGVRSFSTGAASSYFSIDGGTTNIVNYNQDPGGDFGDWFSTGPHTPRVQDAFGTPGVQLDLGPAELTNLDVIGYNLAPVPEPGSLALVGVVGTGLAGYAWRRRRRGAAAVTA